VKTRPGSHLVFEWTAQLWQAGPRYFSWGHNGWFHWAFRPAAASTLAAAALLAAAATRWGISHPGMTSANDPATDTVFPVSGPMRARN
jgi:hypothetical protein